MGSGLGPDGPGSTPGGPYPLVARGVRVAVRSSTRQRKRSAMYWNGHDMNGWGCFTMSIGTVLLWALLLTVAVLLYRTLNRAPESPHTPPAPTPSNCSAWGHLPRP